VMVGFAVGSRLAFNLVRASSRRATVSGLRRTMPRLP
jgi:hypothetical protein